MPFDRNKNRLTVGDAVTIVPGMALKIGRKNYNKGIVSSIDGEYVMVDVINPVGYKVTVERYGSELWKGHDNAKDI